MNAPFRSKPWWVRWIFTADVWVTIYPWINVPVGLDPESRPEVCIHERVHLERQKQLGWIIWVWSYLFNTGFRLHEECLGIAAEVLSLPTGSERELRIARYAYQLTTSMYRNASPTPQDAEASIRAAIAASSASPQVNS